ncbi:MULTISPECIES: LytR/AlgR family response regulator transcription factor [Hydrocarboniphaga]|jgi:DNA-binding LytR/AlgR family response regulator|uniref:Transcriptional regulator protein n=1 Tax=Hydrocarboniphaga effusa AP103 TaxID=1172194 RepID=I8T7B9_9GAMM|nr:MULTISPECIES: LytTR family DNA-binding domain-containing protein [Hydrocarboniphaga]EIT69860.1 transcriptional regulator protein [Hydrocarboniphaga effusa AP103]MDZ4078763.1 LytTR family DNA-binding domain-containing protein [Hydrocarboniphaga sp.]
MSRHPTALIADDEPLLREALASQLAVAWPELDVVAQARNGREAVEKFDALEPDVCFLDVHMPGMSGVEAARHIGSRAHLVFVTAYDHYAVQAFAEGVLDYLVKPVEAARLTATVARLQERMRLAQPALDTQALLHKLAMQLQQGGSTTPSLRWIRAQVGQTLRLIAVDEIDYLRSDSRYTRVAWQGDASKAGEALVRTALKDLVAQLDPQQFVQVHRSVVVNLRAVSHVTRGDNETASVHLKQRSEVLPVSRQYLHLFRQM